MPDYSKQLDDIVRALSRPGPPVWLVAIFSTALGVIGGLVGQFFAMLMADAIRRRNLRGHLYKDLTALCCQVHRVISTEPENVPWQDKPGWYRYQLKRWLSFKGEKEALDNIGTYMGLAERVAIDTLYSLFHEILNNLDAAPAAIEHDTRSALAVFAAFVHDGTLPRKKFRRFLKKKSYDRLLSIVDAYSPRISKEK